MNRSKRSLDYWLGEDDAARFRARKARGTRAPTGIEIWGNRGLGILLIWPLYYGTAWVAAESPRTRVAGSVALGIGVVVAALYIRYLRKPIDPEFLPLDRWWRRRRNASRSADT